MQTAPVNETPFFFELGEHRLFAVLHRPMAGPAQRGVVLCHALAEEKLWSHRVYVNVARELAREGIAVLRFDFRGEGDSDLEFENCGLATRTADALRAAEVLREHEPHLSGCIFLGHRLGSAVAAMATASSPAHAQGLIAWDPIASGRDYLMQLLRSVLASELTQTGSARTRAALLESLEAGETVAIDGYGMRSPLYRDLMGLDWSRLLQAARCPVLAINGTSEPPFWRESKRFLSRTPTMSAHTIQWLREQFA